MKFSIILFTICFVLTVATATSAASKKRSLVFGNGSWVSSKVVSGFVKRAKKDKIKKDKNKGKGKDKDKKKNDNNDDSKPVDAQITFFDGDQLKNSACYGTNGVRSYDANESDMIAAMHMDELELCYKCIEIRNPANNNSIIVKVIDICADCPPDNIDLTPTAFKQLADLDLGRVDIEWRPLDECPDKGRWPIFEEIDN